MSLNNVCKMHDAFISPKGLHPTRALLCSSPLLTVGDLEKNDTVKDLGYLTKSILIPPFPFLSIQPCDLSYGRKLVPCCD